MRGKAPGGGTDLACMRITPAYAGKSDDVDGLVGVHMDHPRVCGEKTKKIP